jgi:hypothetical protein
MTPGTAQTSATAAAAAAPAVCLYMSSRAAQFLCSAQVCVQFKPSRFDPEAVAELDHCHYSLLVLASSYGMLVCVTRQLLHTTAAQLQLCRHAVSSRHLRPLHTPARLTLRQSLPQMQR